MIISFLFFSCTDVVDVDVPYGGSRMVIEASLDWEKGTPGNEQTIKLSEMTPYFNDVGIQIVTGAFVNVTNDNNGESVQFIDQKNGTYTTSVFTPIINQSYTLEVNYNGETYIAKEILTPVVDIEKVDQSTENGFDKDVIEINIYFNDPVEFENYYLSKFHERKDLLPTLLDVSDEFINGNEMHIFYEKFNNDDTNEKELLPGDIVDIELYGISKTYFNYIRLLIEQNGIGGDPFSTIPAPLRGNCTNPANPDNYAWGYFRLTEVNKTTYIVE
jgi:hypothetical protein